MCNCNEGQCEKQKEEEMCERCRKAKEEKEKQLKPYVESDGFFDLTDYQKQ